MMEFTYDGTVRQGFGSDNPNHAAALLCAFFPFLWGWRRLPVLGWGLSLALTIPLALTYSRTGIGVLVLELVLFFAPRLRARRGALAFLSLLLGLVAVVGLVGVAPRFAIDRAVANRPLIWLAGLKLAAVNPLGVGLGRSGELASALLLDGIACRTLVNSHLTLLCEFGAFAGFAWLFFVAAALVCGERRRPAWCAFAGLTLSACSASVFDWGVLLDFADFGGLPLANFVLSWATLLLYLALGAALPRRRPRPRLPAGVLGPARQHEDHLPEALRRNARDRHPRRLLLVTLLLVTARLGRFVL